MQIEKLELNGSSEFKNSTDVLYLKHNVLNIIKVNNYSCSRDIERIIEEHFNIKFVLGQDVYHFNTLKFYKQVAKHLGIKITGLKKDEILEKIKEVV